MNSCEALKGLISSDLNIDGKSGIELKAILLSASEQLHSLKNNKDAILAIQNHIDDVIENEIVSNDFVSSNTKRDILLISNMIDINQKDIYKKAFEIYSKNNDNEFPLPEQENVVSTLVSFLLQDKNSFINHFVNKSYSKINIFKNNNIIAVDSPPGVGKTQFVVKNVLKLFSSISNKKTKVITTASTDIKAKDLHEEIYSNGKPLNGVDDIFGKPMVISDLLKKKKELKQADVLIIDEATLVSSEDVLKLQSLNPDLKIILLGDSKQLGIEYFEGKPSSFKLYNLLSPVMTNRFRTSSILIIDALKELTSNNSNLLVKGNNAFKLTLGYAVRKGSKTNELLGVKNIDSKGDTKNDRLSSFITAFKDNIIDNESFVENILKQAEKGVLTVNISVDERKKGDRFYSAVETAMKNDTELKVLFDNPNIKIKFYTTESIQGSQADYVIAETPYSKKHRGDKLTNEDNQNALNMLISRAKKFALIINNTELNLDSKRKDDNTYDIISNDVIKAKAKQAEGIYKNVLNIFDDEITSVEPEILDTELTINDIDNVNNINELNNIISVNQNSSDLTNASIRRAILSKLKEIGSISYLDGKTYSSSEVKNEFRKIEELESINENYKDVFSEYKLLLQGKFDEFEQYKFDYKLDELEFISKNIYDSNGDEMTNSEISSELNSLDQIKDKTKEQNDRYNELYNAINARIQLFNYNKSKNPEDNGSVKQSIELVDKTNTIISNADKNAKAKDIVDLLQDNGMAYMYSNTEKDSPSNLGIDTMSDNELIELMNNSYDDYKFTFSLKKSIDDLSADVNGVFKLHIIKDGDNYRLVVFKISGNEANIISQLYLDKNNQGGLHLYKMINSLMSDRNELGINFTGNSMIRTSGSIKRTEGNVMIKPSELINKLDNTEGLIHSGIVTITSNDFDYDTVKYAGRSGVFYTYGNKSDIDFNSIEFLKWARQRDNFSLDGGKMLGYYTNNGVTHNIGFIPFNNKTHLLSDIKKTVESTQLNSESIDNKGKEIINKFNTNNNNSRAMVELLSLINSVINNDDYVSNMFIGNNNILFGIDEYNESSINRLKSEIKESFDNLSNEDKSSVKELLKVVFNTTGSVKIENGEYVTKVWNDKTVPDIEFGPILTAINSINLQSGLSSPIFSFDIFKFITTNQQINSNNDDNVLSFFDDLFTKEVDDSHIIPYFNGGMKIDISLTVDTKEERMVISPSNADTDNVFEVNIESVNKPALIVDFIQAINNGKPDDNIEIIPNDDSKPMFSIHELPTEEETVEQKEEKIKQKEEEEEITEEEINAEFTEVELLTIPSTDGVMKSFNNDNSDYIKIEHNGVIGNILINEDISSDKVIRLINEFESKTNNIAEPINSHNGSTGMNILNKGKVELDNEGNWKVTKKMKIEFTNTGKIIDLSNKTIPSGIVIIEGIDISINDRSIKNMDDLSNWFKETDSVNSLMTNLYDDIDEDVFEDPIFNGLSEVEKDGKLFGQIILGLTNNELSFDSSSEESIEFIENVVELLKSNNDIEQLLKCK